MGHRLCHRTERSIECAIERSSEHGIECAIEHGIECAIEHACEHAIECSSEHAIEHAFECSIEHVIWLSCQFGRQGQPGHWLDKAGGSAAADEGAEPVNRCY